MNKTSKPLLVAVLVAFTCTVAYAGPSASNTNSTLNPSSSPSLTGALEVSAISNYTYHGIKLDSNPVISPSLNLAYPLFTGGSLTAGFTQVIGTQGAPWYRTQYNAGLALQAGRVAVSPGVEVITSPDRVSRYSTAVTGKVELDDTGWTPVALHPYVYVSSKVDPVKAGTFYEAGVAPAKNLGALTVSLPVTLGVGSQGYFETDKETHYAFTSVGVAGVYTVTPALSLKGSVTGFSTDRKLGNGKKDFLTFQGGVAVSF